MRFGVSLSVAALALASLAASTLVGSRDVCAQTVTGRLIDNESRQPIVNGTVTLFNDSLGVTVARSLTDSQGRFTLEAPRPGRYTLRGGGLGYRGGLTPRIDLGEGETLTMDIYLVPEPLELEPLEVLGVRIRSELERQGFFRRREQGRGFFLTPAQLKARPPVTEAELLGRAPFVEIRRSWTGSRVLMRSFGRACAPAIFIDDFPVRKGDNLEDHVNFADIVAVEVYRGLGEIPQELAIGLESCGVIMIWTVWSEMRSKGPLGPFLDPARP